MKPAIAAIVTALIAYGAFSFAMWDFNAGNWGQGVRGICAQTAVMSSALASLIAFGMEL